MRFRAKGGGLAIAFATVASAVTLLVPAQSSAVTFGANLARAPDNTTRVGLVTGPMQVVVEQALRQDNPGDAGHPTYAAARRSTPARSSPRQRTRSRKSPSTCPFARTSPRTPGTGSTRTSTWRSRCSLPTSRSRRTSTRTASTAAGSRPGEWGMSGRARTAARAP